MTNLTILTNNIIQWTNTNKIKFESNSDKIIECFRCVIKCWKDSNQESFEHSTDIKCMKHRDKNYLKNDLDIRIIVKIFMYSYCLEDLEEAFEYISKNFIDLTFATVILNVPKDNEKHVDISLLLPLWNFLSSKISQHKIWRLGIADLNLAQLKEFTKAVTVLPSINQQSCSVACSVIPELKDFANHHGIELLSHNDDNHVVSPEKLNVMLNSELPFNCWTPKWVVKCSKIYESRSVIKSLEYAISVK